MSEVKLTPGTVIKVFEDASSFIWNEEMVTKGMALEDFDNYLRSCVKHDSVEEIKAKVPNVEVSDLVLICEFMREKIRVDV